jgi:adenylate cyclase
MNRGESKPGGWRAEAGAGATSAARTLSLAMKWTLAIVLLLVLGMGLLGAYLIAEQEVAFERQTSRLGDLLTDQLGRSVAEPLLADDRFSLELLVRRQLDDRLVVGAAVLDADGLWQARAGLLPEAGLELATGGAAATVRRLTAVGEAPVTATVHVRPVRFQDVVPGYVVLSLNRAPLEHDRNTLIQAMVTATLALIVLIGLLAFPLARWMSDPIRRLAQADETLVLPAAPELDERRLDELGHLARRLRRLTADAAGKRHVEEALHRYLSPGIARSVLSNPEGQHLGGRSLHGSVLFCDIVDFTRMSRDLTPDEVGALVNDYFGAFATAGAFCGGAVDKFIGDCVMILFGVPESDPQHGVHAIVCGMAIVRLAQAINVRRQALGLPTAQFRLAINSGQMLAGNLGSRERMEFTVVGSSVNLASRLCERSPTGSLTVTAQTLAEPGVGEQVRTEALDPLQLKGYDEPVTPYLVRAAVPACEAQVRACLRAVTDSMGEPA